MADVSLKDVRKNFGATPIIKGVSLDITHGEFIVFVGPSGCGKSTLLRLVAGLEEITSGDISIAGKVVNNLPPKDRSIAMVFQSYALFPHMNVRDNVAFGLMIAGASRSEIDEKVGEAARMLKLEALLDRKPSQLSGGQRQRVAIGRAIVRRPDVFLFDEPLSNLDAALRVGTRAEIAKLHRDLGATMIYVTHDQIEAMTLADRIVVLDAGEVRQFGTPLQLYHTPHNKFVAGFIGSPKMNFLDAVVSATAKDSVTVTGENFKSVRAAVVSAGIVKGDAVSLGIRPEHVAIASGKSATCNGKISLVEMLGHETYLEVEIGNGQHISALVEGADAYTVGQSLGLAFAAEDCHVFKADGQAAQRLVLPAIMAKDKLDKNRRKTA
jgi:multiple sugar transport system ATP-binding protein